MKRCLATILVFAFSAAAAGAQAPPAAAPAATPVDTRSAVGLVVRAESIGGYDPATFRECVRQSINNSHHHYARPIELEPGEPLHRFALVDAGRRATVGDVISVELRRGAAQPVVLVEHVDVVRKTSRTTSYPLDGRYGRACDAAFIGVIQQLWPAPNAEASKFLALGDAARAQNDVDTAIGRFAQAMEADPSSCVPPWRIARLYRDAGSMQEAVEWYQHAISRARVDPTIYLEAAETASALGHEDAAADYYQFAISNGMRIPLVFKLAAEHQFRRGLYALASQSLMDALELDPNDITHLPMLVASLDREDRFAEAAVYQERLNRAAPSFEGTERLARFYEQSDSFGEAITPLRQMVAADPDSLSHRRRLGRALEKSGRLPEALDVFQTIRQASPYDAAALRAIGRIRYREKKYAEAIEAFAAARAQNPYDTDAMRLEAMAREFSGDVDGAMSNFAEALRLDSEVRASDVVRYLALARKHDRVDTAIAELDSIARVHDADGRRVIAMAVVDRLAQDGRAGEAAAYLERRIDNLGRSPAPFIALGDLLLRQGDLERAYDTYVRAAIIFSDAQLPLYGASKMHAAGHFDKALSLYNYSIGREPNNVLTLLSLVEVIILSGGNLDLANVYINNADALPKSPAQSTQLRFLMVMWGYATGRDDFARVQAAWLAGEYEKRPIRLEMPHWPAWIDANLTGAGHALARDLHAFLGGGLPIDEFKSRHGL
ncbi:tetratricopeptide repeat protein [bacterium]|nr:tetratricopeptide repeat protein [bacterium]